MKDLLITYAIDACGNRTDVNVARKGQKYFCVDCGQELIFRISKRSYGQKYYRRPHFTHRYKGDCSPETVLHNQFKKTAALFLQHKIEKCKPFYISWECTECGEQHQYNLLESIDSVKIEYRLEDCRPDISLLTDRGQVKAVIEVIVSHKPENKTLRFYKDNNIILVQVNIKSFEDIDNLESVLSQPSQVIYCLSPICEQCGNRQNSVQLQIVDTTCYKCHSKMKVAFINTSNRYLTPSEFTIDEVLLAEKYGAIIQKRYSKSLEETYFANVCKKCNAFVGDNYIHDYIYEPSKSIPAGHACLHCIDEKILRKNEQYAAEYCAKAEMMRKISELKWKNEIEPKPCLECGGILMIRQGKYGYFYGCCNYPDCTYTEDIKL